MALEKKASRDATVVAWLRKELRNTMTQKLEAESIFAKLAVDLAKARRNL